MRYLSEFGRDPAVTLMTVQSTSPESLRMRAAEGLMPYFHSKTPLVIDATIRGVAEVLNVRPTWIRRKPDDGSSSPPAAAPLPVAPSRPIAGAGGAAVAIDTDT